MLPLSVITWRLGKIDSDVMEPFMLNDEQLNKVLMELSVEFEGVFYLSTCQRIILVTSTSDQLIVDNLYSNFLRLIGINPKYKVHPEFYHSVEALHHLATVVSSLDSVVIGEVHIQGQFKEAFRKQQKFMDNSLKNILSQIIRTGKRVRDRSLLKGDKVSTISIVQEVLDAELRSANSIGIIGTGDMGKAVLDHLSPNFDNINIYSRTASRIGTKLSKHVIEDFQNLRCHDVLILATSTQLPIISKSTINEICNKEITIVDLGMPRNCDTNVTELSYVNLLGMEDLVLYSKNNLNHTTIESAYGILEHEITQIIHTYRKSVKSNAVVSLRQDLLETASSHKMEFSTDDPKYSKKFDQFINQLIHVSQRHLENIILENHPTN